MLGCPDLRDEARHSVSEHKEIDDKLGELVQTDMDSSSWMEAFGELQHRYLHHIEEEEEEMFPKASEGLTSEAEERIAKIFERSEEHTSELQSLMSISYAVFCLKKKKKQNNNRNKTQTHTKKRN